MPTTAPYSYVDYGLTGDLVSPQTSGTFNSVPLEIINTTDVYVIRTVGATKTTLGSSDFTVTESGSTLNIQITNPSSLDAGDIIRIGRTTEIGNKTRSFTDGSVLKASDLNEQNNQLLFAVQETTDGGIGSLPIDTDGKFDAGGKVIKNLATGTGTDDSVSKGYVDGLQLYGTAATIPQAWSFTTAAGDIPGGTTNRAYTLTDPVPNSSSDELYIIEVDGVVQTPDTYTVTETTGTYTLTLTGASTTVDNGVSVSVRNFGVSRNVFEQPMKAASGSTPSFTIQRLGSQSANLQEWVDEASTPNVLASVNIDGDASFVDVAASANATVGGTLGVTGATTLTGGIAGNLNILTGALQVGGTSTLQIRQVVKATRSTSTTTINANKISHFAGIDITIQPTSSTSRLFFFGVHNIPADTGNGAPEEGRPLGLGIILNSGASDRAAGVIVPSDERTVADNYVKLDGTSRFIHWTSTVMVDSSPQPVTHSVVGAISSGSTSSRVYSFVLSSYFTDIGWDPTASSSSGGYITYEFEHQSADIYCIEIG